VGKKAEPLGMITFRQLAGAMVTAPGSGPAETSHGDHVVRVQA